MATKENVEDIDAILTFIFLKKIVTPVNKTDAYKLDLVDQTGKVINKPETDEEKKALTVLDKAIFKIKRLLGNKRTQLNNFLFLNTLNNNLYNKLVVRGTVQQRAEIKRIKKDVEKLQEKYDMDYTDLSCLLLNECIREDGD